MQALLLALCSQLHPLQVPNTWLWFPLASVILKYVIPCQDVGQEKCIITHGQSMVCLYQSPSILYCFASPPCPCLALVTPGVSEGQNGSPEWVTFIRYKGAELDGQAAELRQCQADLSDQLIVNLSNAIKC